VSEFINAIIEYRFMQYAVLACLLASIGCGVTGAFVAVKQLGSLAGGIAHAVLAGMGIAYFLGGSPMLGAIMMALLSAILIGFITLKWKQDEDTLIAAFWSVGMAVGIVFISLTPGSNVNLTSYLFGNILLVTGADLVRMLILDIVVVALVTAYYRQFLATVFDEEFARVRGINTGWFYILLLSMIALTVVLLIQIVGLILVIALLVLPAATAIQFVKSLPLIMVWAVLLSMAVTFTGLAVSYHPDLPSGAVIVMVAGLVYIASAVFGRVRSRAG
jgi:zinc transport system permease protein